MRAAFYISIAITSTLALTACPPLDPKKVPQCTGHEVYPDPCAATPPFGSPESQPTLCQSACASLRKSNCEEGFPSPQGGSCLQTCEQSSKASAWPLKCWAEAETSEKIKACGSIRCRVLGPTERL